MKWLFSRAFWRRFGRALIGFLYRQSSLKYDYGRGYADVRLVGRYYLEPETKKLLERLLKPLKLESRSEDERMRRIMVWLNDHYPSKIFYTHDKSRETWNHPADTIKSFEDRFKVWQELGTDNKYTLRRDRRWSEAATTDCDDYAILLYNLARTAGIPADNLYFAFLKTTKEWHLNLMYFAKDGVPYAIEGTYYPDIAIKNFLRTPYFHNRRWVGSGYEYYYEHVKWLFNEKEVQRHNGRLNNLNG